LQELTVSGIDVFCDKGETMHADRVDLSWDLEKSRWIVRIEAGNQVIRRHCDIRKEADEETLHVTAKKTVRDEGYEPELTPVYIHR
jgi:hypothetical protein